LSTQALRVTHPTAVSTLKLAQTADPSTDWSQHEFVEERDEFNIIQYGERLFAVPKVLGPIYLHDEQQRSQMGILSADSREELLQSLSDRDQRPLDQFSYVEVTARHKLIGYAGKYFAIPVDTRDLDLANLHSIHDESIVVATSLTGLRSSVIDTIGECFEAVSFNRNSYYLFVAFGSTTVAVPPGTEVLDLRSPGDAQQPGVLSSENGDFSGTSAGRSHRPTKVEYAGWLPSLMKFGKCGTHPQFGHCALPPNGYQFLSSHGPLLEGVGNSRLRMWAVLARRWLGIGRAVARLVTRCTLQGVNPWKTLRFLYTRGPMSQVMLPRRSELVFYTSLPATYSQQTWVVEIEDVTTLFFPHAHNGQTENMRLRDTDCFRPLRALLEDDNCRGVITHIKNTADAIPNLFRSEKINAKTRFIPMGVDTPKDYQQHEESDTIRMLFTNSWHQAQEGFYLRGGLDVLEAFTAISQTYPNVELILRTQIPPSLPARYRKMLTHPNITIIDEFLSTEDLDELRASCHIYLLPSARIHIVSLLQAMSFGMVPIVTDGWAFDEYIDHDRNGIIVRGREGKVSWYDAEEGMLRENYSSMYSSNTRVAQGVIEAMARLIEDRTLRQRIGTEARTDIEHRYNLTNWNLGLKAAFDFAMGVEVGTDNMPHDALEGSK
jgi:glycosyltransferase involved in cell wall biosynthesis